MKKLTFVFVSALVVLSFGCKKKSSGANAGASIAKMTEFKDEMCKCTDAKCTQDVSDRMTKWTQEQKAPPKMTPDETKKYGEISEALGKCMQNAVGATAPVPAGSDAAPTGNAGSAAVATGPDGLPKECAEYQAQVEKLKTCEKLPAKAREALVKGYTDAAAGWAKMPAEAKAGLDKSCKAGTDAVVAAAKEACGW